MAFHYVNDAVIRLYSFVYATFYTKTEKEMTKKPPRHGFFQRISERESMKLHINAILVRTEKFRNQMYHKLTKVSGALKTTKMCCNTAFLNVQLTLEKENVNTVIINC